MEEDAGEKISEKTRNARAPDWKCSSMQDWRGLWVLVMTSIMKKNIFSSRFSISLLSGNILKIPHFFILMFYVPHISFQIYFIFEHESANTC